MRKTLTKEKLLAKIKTFARKKARFYKEKREQAISESWSAKDVQRIENKLFIADSIPIQIEEGWFNDDIDAARQLWSDLVTISPIESKKLRDDLDDLFELYPKEDEIKPAPPVAVRYDEEGRACYWNGWTFDG